MSNVKMAPRRLAHFNLYVTDLARSTDFYHRVCGIHHIAGEPDVPIQFLTNGSSHHELGLIELHEGDRIGRDGFVQGTTRKGQRPGLNHLGWEMQNEELLVDAYRRLLEEPHTFHTADHTIAHSVYVADPEGNMHEFFADTAYDWPQMLRGDLDRLTGKWDPLSAAPSKEAYFDRGIEHRAVQDAAVRPNRISHGVLRVQDLNTMREWMQRVAGLEEVFSSEAEGRAMFRGADSSGPVDLILQQGGEGTDALTRMAFQVPTYAELDDAMERLAKLQIPTASSTGSDTVRGFVLKDPDGLEIEFYAARDPANLSVLAMVV